MGSRGWRRFGASTVALLVVASACSGGKAGGPDAGSPEAGGPGPLGDLGGGVAVAYQIDVAHTGNQPASALRPPLTRRWSVDLHGNVSYPLIAGGRVFVTVAGATATANVVDLRALEVTTGDTVWGPIPVGENWANAAFDDGKVYVMNDAGEMTAFDARSGDRAWTSPVPFPQYSASTPPVARGGMVFAAATGLGGTAFALDAGTGALKWSARVSNGDDSSPALGQEGLFVSYACLQTYAFEPSTGSLLWHADGSCEGGGGMTLALYQGRLWGRDWVAGNAIFDARTGSKLQTFGSDRIPAFLDERAFVLLGSTLSALDLETFAAQWSFTGDGTLASAPLVAGGVVYVGSRSGRLFAVDPATGTSSWSGDVGGGVASPGNTSDAVLSPLSGLAAGQGVLLVPAGTKLVAFQ